MANIFIVEDDVQLAGLMQDYLTSKQLNVSVEHDGTDAVERILEARPDLVILDLMLPGKDGVTICRELRPQFENPILMLTASEDSIDQIVGLEVGADDFVQKPIEPRVLLARIRALLRRALSQEAKPTQSDEIQFRELQISPSRRAVKLNGQDIELSTQEYDFLELLTNEAGNIVSREQVFQSLKNMEYDGQNRFADILISQIRKKLGGAADQYLKTVRGKGYLFIV